MSIAVSGNHFVNQSGSTVVLRGVDTSGTEYACVSQQEIFDGKQEASPTSIAAMKSWGFNSARVELNESCWSGSKGFPLHTPERTTKTPSKVTSAPSKLPACT